LTEQSQHLKRSDITWTTRKQKREVRSGRQE
jgi:hypothetical protein